ncbi:putative SAC3/GANP family [Paratrimastix pyriformis]|uniref:SAC3/GANP family n=1 Tax=Paratrimastix pyriformis TaxID=342808 RepID=A0ABQ8UV67_9EUKA|nr:putative SAC3/GANP family [Paratrimastix pyriformis]
MRHSNPYQQPYPTYPNFSAAAYTQAAVSSQYPYGMYPQYPTAAPDLTAPKLRKFCARVFNACPKNKEAAEKFVEAQVQEAYAKGELETRDWDSVPIPAELHLTALGRRSAGSDPAGVLAELRRKKAQARAQAQAAAGGAAAATAAPEVPPGEEAVAVADAPDGDLPPGMAPPPPTAPVAPPQPPADTPPPPPPPSAAPEKPAARKKKRKPEHQDPLAPVAPPATPAPAPAPPTAGPYLPTGGAVVDMEMDISPSRTAPAPAGPQGPSSPRAGRPRRWDVAASTVASSAGTAPTPSPPPRRRPLGRADLIPTAWPPPPRGWPVGFGCRRWGRPNRIAIRLSAASAAGVAAPPVPEPAPSSPPTGGDDAPIGGAGATPLERRRAAEVASIRERLRAAKAAHAAHHAQAHSQATPGPAASPPPAASPSPSPSPSPITPSAAIAGGSGATPPPRIVSRLVEREAPAALATSLPGALLRPGAEQGRHMTEAQKRQSRAARFGTPAGSPTHGSAPPTPPSCGAGADEGDEGARWAPIVGTSTALEKAYFPPDPANVRPLAVLQQALRHVQERWQRDHDYPYVWDQMKSIRQDLTVQHIRSDFTVEVYENHARMALEHKDMSEYHQCQAKLLALYKDGLHGKVMEFLAYQLLYWVSIADQAAIGNLLKQLNPKARRNRCLLHALEVMRAVTTHNAAAFFRLYRSCPNMGRFLMDNLAQPMRHEGLRILAQTCRPYYPLGDLAAVLGFGRPEECASWLGQLGIHITEAPAPSPSPSPKGPPRRSPVAPPTVGRAEPCPVVDMKVAQAALQARAEEALMQAAMDREERARREEIYGS